MIIGARNLWLTLVTFNKNFPCIRGCGNSHCNNYKAFSILRVPIFREVPFGPIRCSAIRAIVMLSTEFSVTVYRGVYTCLSCVSVLPVKQLSEHNFKVTLVNSLLLELTLIVLMWRIG